MNKPDLSVHPTTAADELSHRRDGHRGFPYRKPATATAGTAPSLPQAGDLGPAFTEWAKGYGVIQHDAHTQLRIHRLLDHLQREHGTARMETVLAALIAADRLCSAGMWLVAHMTYARRVRLDGEALAQEDFKPVPEGHTGGALNMVPAYVGYLLANAISGNTRGWMMGQGHCVAAIDAVNVLMGNLHPEQAERYGASTQGLSRLCQDFYSYAIDARGRPAVPMGSHVNAHTAGGMIEGGYLGFGELQYVHAPLPGESLVAFLSDGAFEEQRGSDWAPRWWRGEDCGNALPVMILNGRRIEQRSSLEQDGGVAWFIDHLRLNGFEPLEIDGTDPAAFAWTILTMEESLASQYQAVQSGLQQYPVRLPYTIAHAPKGFGFPGAGTNLAHNLPLGGNPATDSALRAVFNQAVAKLWVEAGELSNSTARLQTHAQDGRPLERDHALSRRAPSYTVPGSLPWQTMPGGLHSPMQGVDQAMLAVADANPALRIRIGNPDELRSNGMGHTLDRFHHRASHPEAGAPESLDGKVITALNEEAVVSAVIANKAGLNMVVSYEAFAVKMLGAMRQEVIFARQLAEVGRPAGWLSWPVLLSSHAWENGKNELSHQDTTLPEVWLAESSDRARTVFPPDWNSAVATLDACYRTRGQIWCVVAPKRPVPQRLSQTDSERLVRDGALRLVGSGGSDEKLILTAVGAYQLSEVLRASRRLMERDIPHAVVYLYEPGRLRLPRDEHEAAHVLDDAALATLYPHHSRARVLLAHTRPEPLLGALRRIDTGPQHTVGLGFRNRGGTLDPFGMLFANGACWAHVLQAASQTLGLGLDTLLLPEERDAVLGLGDPAVLR
ncbi:xylulose 5-phosphate 3-epimerase [Chitinimonas sp.]|uniref:xylulose 5-phosphate 3-epimerase n=1 Tax=Chitinimonas sp. TaxID=1934313 RepID=UPI002F956A0C